jgi:DNA-binding FadR family transcriptional regulator
MLEALALRLGFDEISISKLKKIKSALLAAKQLGDAEASLKADEQLHELILESCPNRTLAEVTGRLRQQCQAFRALRAMSMKAAAISEERLAIVRSILAGDRSLAESRLSTHILQGIHPDCSKRTANSKERNHD